MMDRQKIRQIIADAVLKISYEGEKEGLKPIDVLPEIIAALISLSATVIKNNAGLSRNAFMAVCNEAADEQWPPPSTKQH